MNVWLIFVCFNYEGCNVTAICKTKPLAKKMLIEVKAENRDADSFKIEKWKVYIR